MEDLTCINCGVRFVAKLDDGAIDYQRAKEEHKEHFKSDWHRYNLKRKILDLPPITAEAFAEKVLQKRAEENKSEEFSGRCSLCNKTFASANAFENHIKSRKHRELERATNMKTEVKNNIVPCDKTPAESNAANNEEEVEMVEEVDEEEWTDEGLGLEECLFCTKVSKTMEKNIAHMSLVHGFFIPDADCVSDLEGLMQYLGELVGECHMCLWCKADKFQDTTSVQQHMVDKGHCKMLRDKGDIFEFADFYDYRKTYKDELKKRSEGQENIEETKNDEEEEEEEVEPFVLDDSAAFMVLPSGASIGHRDLARYFRQKLQPDKRVILYRNSSTVSKVVQHYKALGWTGTTGVAAEQKAKDIAYVKRVQARQFMKLGVNGNRLQRHFRDQVFGF